MAQHRLLYLDDSHLAAFHWQGGALKEEGRFTPNDDGLVAFADYLYKHRGSNYRILADIAEEGFQADTLPYTQGSDRRAMLERKLGQLFYGSPLATSMSCGREAAGRRDEKFLFMALTRSQLFEPWLAALRGAEAQLAGIYSLAQLGEAFLPKLPAVGERRLLVTITRAGIRQSFYENGRLRFSRLTALPPSDPHKVAASCAAETVKIQQYLLGQRLIPRGVTLPLVALIHPAQMNAFKEYCGQLDGIVPALHDLHDAAKACGLKTLPEDSRSETLFLHLLAGKAPRDQFAQPAERRFYRLWQVRAALKGVGAIALAGCLLFAANQYVDAIMLHDKTSDVLAQAQSDSEKYHAIQITYPPMPASTDQLRAVIDRYDMLEQRSDTPKTLYLAIARALDESPRVDIERIHWSLGKAQQQGAQPPGTPPPKSAAKTLSEKSIQAVAVIDGLLPAQLASDQRAQIETVDAFANALRRDASLRVEVERMPFDIESGKALKSAASAEKTAHPKFIVRVSREL